MRRRNGGMKGTAGGQKWTWVTKARWKEVWPEDKKRRHEDRKG